MMIKIISGDILDADVEALVNTVNCTGVMGRGIALQFKKRFDENFKAYKKACDAGDVQLGTVLVFDYGQMFNPRYVINFPTKGHWRSKSKLSDVEAGLQALTKEVQQRGIQSIAIPPLGCGLGGLNWSDVRPLIESAFAELSNVHVLIYEPSGAPTANAMAKSAKVPSMTVGRSAMLALMRQYLAACMDPFVTLLEVHKLMYFLTVSGESMDKLRFQKGPYGPYSENLRHVLNAIEGYFTEGFGDGADDPEKPIELLPAGIPQSEAYLEHHPETRQNVQRVAELIGGFETPSGMELLSTVHWVAQREGATDPEQAKRLIDQWSERKKMMFPQRHVDLAWQVLKEHRLLPS